MTTSREDDPTPFAVIFGAVVATVLAGFAGKALRDRHLAAQQQQLARNARDEGRGAENGGETGESPSHES